MLSDDGRFVIIYNGEVYNFRELRCSLEQLGHQFHGQSDTEVVLHSFIEWGESTFALFDGMFAMAIWDDWKRRLYLARDRFGIKPLYFQSNARGLVFGSEIKALLATDEIDRTINWHGLHEYLYYDAPLGVHTIYKGICKLLPGHKFVRDDATVRLEPYASIHDVDEVTDDYNTSIERVRNLLDGAVRSHLVSDVPVGVFLSGGIDSSAITAFASKHYSGRLKTFTTHFDFEGRGTVNELPMARTVANHFDTDHYEVPITGGEVASVIERLTTCHDAPFGDAANIPLYLLSEQLSGEHRVILQGDGGDEIFAGYLTHSLMAIGPWARTLAYMGFWATPFVRRWKRLYKIFNRLNFPDPSLRFAMVMANRHIDDPPSRLFTPEIRSLLDAHDPFARYRAMYSKFVELDATQRALYTDCAIILPDVYFEKVDKSTMAHGIEVRVPLVDTQLARYVMGLPASYKIKGLSKKRLLRRALKGIVPDAVLNNPKVGFGVPVSFWLRTSLANYMREILLDNRRPSSSLFDRARLHRRIEDHIEGREDNGRLLYRLLNLALWYDQYRIAA